MNKPFAQSCAENQEVILATIRPLLSDTKSVLEIGSGTGQHAVYFAKQLNHLHWQTSDLPAYHEGIELWIKDSQLSNVKAPITLDVADSNWPNQKFDAIFTANTLHIMSFSDVQSLFKNIIQVLNANARLLIYGPFNYNNQFTSESNSRFDAWLKSRDPKSGIRHFEDINDMAKQAGLKLIEDIEMPVNNRLLYFQNQRESE